MAQADLPTDGSAGETWTNWSGLVHSRPSQIARPASEAEIIALVRAAAEAGQTVRVAGSGHSFTALCETSDLLLSLEHLRGIEWTDASAQQASILSGSKIKDLGAPLAAAGLALENQGDVDVQAIAGAVSTGTHGTGPQLGSISTQVVGMRIVTDGGNAIDCSVDTDEEVFRAAQVSLGALGVITAVRLRLLPLYRLHERVRRQPIQDCLDQLDAQIAQNRHFEFFWYPADDAAFTKTLNPTEAPAVPLTVAAPTSGAGLSSAETDRVAESWQIFPTVRENRFNEMEFAVPAERGVECFLEVRDLIRRKHTDITWPIEFRTQAADNVFLSPAFGRATVAISIHQAATLPHEAFFADAEAIFRRHQGRPHWGKLHSLRRADLAVLYPDWERFHAVRRQLDPHGRFLNAHLRRLFID